MKYLAMAAGLLLLLSYVRAPKTINQEEARKRLLQKKSTAISCAPLRSKDISLAEIGLLPGTGKHHWKISTSSDSAQIYFDQGMNLYYSFHIIESLASFLKAQTFDRHPMLYWAEALAYGPNINDLGYTQSPDALTALDNARKSLSRANPQERALLAAMEKRYSSDPAATRLSLNQSYRDAMAALYQANKKDPEITALYADALMVMHPWDLYHGNGEPKAWTPQLVGVLEGGLQRDPSHPGLNHYYIHAVEGSREPGRALASADRLGGLVPSAAHMVHMPSHIYIRTGNYAQGIRVNEQSLQSHETYLKYYPAVALNPFIYKYHNTHMMAACAIMNGDPEVALRSAAKCHDDISASEFTAPAPLNEMIQYLYAAPVFAMVRYGKWDELIRLQSPDSLLYYSLLVEFGKGMAYARKGDLARADQMLASITRRMERDTVLKLVAFNSAYDASNVAAHLLRGVIAEERGDLVSAEAVLRKAAELEENMVYNEPKDWLLPPLQYLGQVQLKAGKYAEAERSFRKDLSFNPNNTWSLTGLKKAMKKM